MQKAIHSEKEMHEFAKKFVRRLRPGKILGLVGELGAGKTTFVKGLAKALGVKEKITSPTFVLIKPYKTKHKKIKNLIHVDAYRITEGEELMFVGLDDFSRQPDTIVAIEWADKIKKNLPRGRTKWIKFKLGKKPNERIIEIKD